MLSTVHQLLYLSIIEGISWWDYHDHGRFTRMKQQQWVTSMEFSAISVVKKYARFDSGLGGCGWDISWEEGPEEGRSVWKGKLSFSLVVRPP